jgi:hypothetical protein
VGWHLGQRVAWRGGLRLDVMRQALILSLHPAWGMPARHGGRCMSRATTCNGTWSAAVVGAFAR